MKKWLGKIVQCCGAAAILLLPASHVDAMAASIKHLGMAGTAIADPQDALSAAWNPALAIDVGNRMDVGGIWEETHGKAKIEGNTGIQVAPGVFDPFVGLNGTHHASRHNNYFDPEFGVNAMLGCDCNLALGLVVYNKGYLKTDYHRRLATLASPVPGVAAGVFGTSNPGLEAIQEVVAPVAAMRWDCHAFGAALQICVQRFKVKGLEGLDNPADSRAPSHVTNRNADYSYGIGVMLGYLYQPSRDLSFGLSWEPRTTMTRLHNYSGFLVNGGRLDYPERFSAGVKFYPFSCELPDLHINVDYQWIRWKGVHSLGNAAPTSFASLPANRLGLNHGPGFGWANQPFVRFGVEYGIPCYDLVLRAGYRWTHSPVRSKAAVVNMLTLELVENVVTVGATWTPWCGTEISAFYAHGFQHRLRGTVPLDALLGGGIPTLYNSLDAAGLSWGLIF